MNLQVYWKIVRKRLPIIGVLMVAALALALFVSLRQTPIYTATTRLFLNSGTSSALLPYYTGGSASDMATTYSEYMRTRSFADVVVKQLGGTVTAGEVQAALSTRFVPNQFFDISATHANPAMAQTLANTTAQVLIAENLARQQAQQEQARSQQDPAQAAERTRLQEIQKSLQAELDYYGQRIDSLQTQIANLEASPPSQETDKRLLDLREELIRNQTLRVQSLSTLATTQSTIVQGQGTTSVDTAIVIDEAQLPTAAPTQNLMQYLLAALFVALGLGVGISFLLEYLDYTIKTPEELDLVYGMPALGVTGVIPPGDAKSGQGEDLIALTSPRSPIVESFRALRTNIQFANPEGAVRSLLITSAGPAEGKSMTAANLAVIVAQGGSRVILVDADLRKPKLHRLFKVAKAPGLTNLIVDPAGDIETYLQPTEVENLWVLTCGVHPPNPAELLGSPRAAEVMKELEQHADMVIYDTPPAATVTDAVVMATRVGGVLQVVQARHTRRDLVLQGKAVLEKVGANLLGPVLNQVSLADLGYYSYYYYYGGYYRDGEDGPPPGEDGSSRRRRGSRSRRSGQPRSESSPALAVKPAVDGES